MPSFITPSNPVLFGAAFGTASALFFLALQFKGIEINSLFPQVLADMRDFIKRPIRST